MPARATIWKAWTRFSVLVPLCAAIAQFPAVAPAQAQEPIKIGFSVSLTGGLASSGKAHLLSKQIWVEEVNARGGLLGREEVPATGQGKYPDAQQCYGNLASHTAPLAGWRGH